MRIGTIAVAMYLYHLSACGSQNGPGQGSSDATVENLGEGDLDLKGAAPTPVISPNGGVMTGPIQVSISGGGGRISVFYTLDGSIPNKGSTAYSAPFTLDGSKDVTVKGIAYKNGSNPSAVVTAVFTAESAPAPSPSPGPSPAPGPAPSPDPTDCSQVIDQCPVAGGVTWQCKKRFMYGVNYAWHHFGGDFGGISSWNQAGVAGTPAVDLELADMKAQGVSVVRWWIFPDFRSDGVRFDSSDSPLGLGGTFLADLNKALELAEKHDLYLMLDLFSFDAFRPTTVSYGVTIRGLNPIVLDSTKRRALVENVIRPMARAVEASPYRKRVIAWDLINEPEWAMTGSDRYGDPSFNCNSGLQCISHDQMESFLKDVVTVLRSESKALITVGGAAIKWPKAWSGLGLDFYQFHTYDWVNQWYPYTKTPADYGVSDKPVVMGEFPMTGLSGVSVPTLLSSYLSTGYAGGLGWAVTDGQFNWQGTKSILRDFAAQHSCVLQY